MRLFEAPLHPSTVLEDLSWHLGNWMPSKECKTCEEWESFVSYQHAVNDVEDVTSTMSRYMNTNSFDRIYAVTTSGGIVSYHALLTQE